MEVPYVPVPETNGEEWDRLDPVRGLDLLIQLILDGEYGGVISRTGGISKTEMELRTTALALFEVWRLQVRKEVTDSSSRNTLKTKL